MLNAANILVLIGVMPLPWVLVSGELGKHGRASDGVVARVAVFAVCAFFVMLGIAARKAPRAACCVGLAVHSAIVGLGLVAMVCRGHAPSLPLALALPGLFTVVLIVGLVAAVQLRSLSRAPASP